MARQLSADPASVIFDDKISGTKIKVFFRLPQADERTAYEAALWQRNEETGKVVNNVRATRRKHGEAVITGFRAGDFVDEKGAPIASETADEHYREDWKDLVKTHAPDLLELLAVHVFEPSWRGRADEAVDPF